MMVFFWITILSCDFIGNKCFDHFYRIKSAKKYDNIPWEIVVKRDTFYFCCQLTAMMSVRNVLLVIIRQKQ